MIDTELVRQAFGELERHAPAEAEVLAGVAKGIGRRRRRQQVLRVTGAAAAAGLLALGVVLMAPGRPDDGSVAVSPPPNTPSSPVPAVPPPPVLPFTVGAPPAGYRLDFWQTGTAWSNVEYVGANDLYRLSVEVSDTSREGYAISSAKPTTIGGRPGQVVRLGPDKGYIEIRWQLASERWAMVGGHPQELTEEQLRAVAESLTEAPTPVQVNSGVVLPALPEGYLVNGWSGIGGQVIGGDLCRIPTDARKRREPNDCIGFGVQDGAAPRSISNRRTPTGVVEVPVDQVRVVGGVETRATADGKLVYVQVDPAHYVSVSSGLADVALLRELAAGLTVRADR